MSAKGNVLLSQTTASFYEVIALRKAIALIQSGGLSALKMEENKALNRAHRHVNDMKPNQFKALLRNLQGMWPEEKEQQVIIAELVGGNWYNRKKPEVKGAEEVVSFIADNLPGVFRIVDAGDRYRKKMDQATEASA